MCVCVCVCVCVSVCPPNKAPTASPAVCGWEKAAMALKMSGAPLPRARKVTPSAQVKENHSQKRHCKKNTERGNMLMTCRDAPVPVLETSDNAEDAGSGICKYHVNSYVRSDTISLSHVSSTLVKSQKITSYSRHWQVMFLEQQRRSDFWLCSVRQSCLNLSNFVIFHTGKSHNYNSTV